MRKRHNKASLGLSSLILSLMMAFLFIFDTMAYASSQEMDREVARLIKEAPLTQSYRDAGALVFLKEGRMKVEKGGVFTLTIHVICKVLDEKAASDYSQMSFYYNSHYDEATLMLARTIKEDGTVRSVSSDAVQIKTSSRGKEYSDIRFLTFSLPALEKGSIFEYEIRTQRKIPLIENRWSEMIAFQNYHHSDVSARVDPVYKSTFILELPEGEPICYETDNIKIEPIISKKSPLVVYTWEARNLPALPIELSMPSLDEIFPHIHLSSIKTWDEVAQWADKLFLPATEVVPEIEAKAREITREAKADEEKIEAIFYFMESSIKYVAADLNRGGFKPHPAHEVLKNRYGDCKDQAVLFISLLKSVGIEAHPALVNTDHGPEINKAVPSPDFNHVIVHILRKENSLWLDTTSGVARFPNLFWPCQNRWALVSDGQKGKLLKTTGSNPEDNEGRMSVDTAFKDSVVRFNTIIRAGGALSDLFKAIMKMLSPDRQKAFIGDFHKQTFTGLVQVGAVEISDVTNPRLPFTASAVIEFTDDQVQTAPYYSLGFGLQPLLSFFTSLTTLPHPENRKNAYLFAHPFHLVLDSVCPPPRKGMKPDGLPLNQSIETPFFTFNTEYVRDGDSVRVKQVFVIQQTRIEREQYRPFYERMQEVLKKSPVRINFAYQRGSRQSIEFEEAVKKEPENVKALLNLAKDYLRKGRYKEAKDLLDKSVIIEPQNGEIHYLLGIAAGYLDLFEESKKEFGRAKELGYRP